MELVKKFSVDR